MHSNLSQLLERHYNHHWECKSSPDLSESASVCKQGISISATTWAQKISCMQHMLTHE